MKILLFTALIASGCMFAYADFHWKDCSTGCTGNDAVTFHYIDASPIPVAAPGPVIVSLIMTINRQIDHLFVDTEVTRLSAFGNSTIPCIFGRKFGSCNDIDACAILNSTSLVSDVSALDVIGTIFLSALGHDNQCPISQKNVALIVNQTFMLQAMPATLAVISDGDFHVKLMFKDSPFSTDYVGCLEFDAGFKRAGRGFLFGDGGN